MEHMFYTKISAAPQISSKNAAENSQNSVNEDEYILEVLQTPNIRQEVVGSIVIALKRGF